MVEKKYNVFVRSNTGDYKKLVGKNVREGKVDRFVMFMLGRIDRDNFHVAEEEIN